MEGAPVIADSKDGGRSHHVQGTTWDRSRSSRRFTLPSGRAGRHPGTNHDPQSDGQAARHGRSSVRFRQASARRRDVVARCRRMSVSVRCPTAARRMGRCRSFRCAKSPNTERLTPAGKQPQPTPIWGAEGWVWSPPCPKGEGTALPHRQVQPGRDGMVADGAGEARDGDRACVSAAPASGSMGIPRARRDSSRASPTRSARRDSRRSTAIGSRPSTPIAATSKRKAAGRPRTTIRRCIGTNSTTTSTSSRSERLSAIRRPGTRRASTRTTRSSWREFYSRDLMLAEAAKAKELGCEALYLDPGWDTGPSHHIWDAARLGSMESFVKTCKKDYGLKVSLWIGTGGMPPTYADPEACPPEARVVDKDGTANAASTASPRPAFLDTKEKRLLELCRNGVAFMMFDSTQYSGPCYDKTHGHSIPSTREEHAKALLELTRRIKTQVSQRADRDARSDQRAGRHPLHADLLRLRPAAFLRLPLGPRVHVELDGRSSVAPGRQPVLLQPGLQHPALSARQPEARQRERPGVLVVCQHVPAPGHGRQVGQSGGLGGAQEGHADVSAA